jgi:phage terminase large subunit GpA-like protein
LSLPDWLDETYFRQITAEHLTDEKINGKVRRVWKLKASERDNHILDCRQYTLALADIWACRASRLPNGRRLPGARRPRRSDAAAVRGRLASAAA